MTINNRAFGLGVGEDAVKVSFWHWNFLLIMAKRFAKVFFLLL